MTTFSIILVNMWVSKACVNLVSNAIAPYKSAKPTRQEIEESVRAKKRRREDTRACFIPNLGRVCGCDIKKRRMKGGGVCENRDFLPNLGRVCRCAVTKKEERRGKK
jgi:hypothetical protein